MHRHGYKGRKFGRERDQRRALMKGLADSLVLNEAIETTLPKAKELVPYIEKLVTKAKVGDLHNRRQVLQGLQTITAAHKLVDDLTPRLTSRNSGHFRIQRTIVRRGDNTQMAKVSFIFDDQKAEPAEKEAKAPVKKATAKPKAEAKK